MMKLLLERNGFGKVIRRGFCESEYPEFREPLHPIGAPPVWVDVAEWQGVTDGITGFDRSPETSLFVEAEKTSSAPVRRHAFGIVGARGLDPTNFSWWAITRG